LTPSVKYDKQVDAINKWSRRLSFFVRLLEVFWESRLVGGNVLIPLAGARLQRL